MKYIFIIVIIIIDINFNLINAQIRKGTFNYGLGININSKHSDNKYSSGSPNFIDNSDSLSFLIFTNCGYFIDNNLIMGGIIGVSKSKYLNNIKFAGDSLITEIEGHSELLHYGIYFKQYFSIVKPILFYIHENLIYSVGSTIRERVSGNTFSNEIFTLHLREWSIIVSPGLNYLISKRFSVNAELGSFYFRRSSENKKYINIPLTNRSKITKYLGINTSIAFGVQMYF